jgi:hypothetical protein
MKVATAVVVPDLPDSDSTELRGYYGHELKNLVIAPDNKLYVEVEIGLWCGG